MNPLRRRIMLTVPWEPLVVVSGSRPPAPVDGLGLTINHLSRDGRAVAVDVAQEGADPTVGVDLPVVALEKEFLGEGVPRKPETTVRRRAGRNLQAGAKRPRSR